MDLLQFSTNAMQGVEHGIESLIVQHFDENMAMYHLMEKHLDKIEISANLDEASLTYTIKANKDQKKDILDKLDNQSIEIYDHQYITQITIYKNEMKITLTDINNVE